MKVSKVSEERFLDYKDVFIIPQFSEVTSRSDVDTSITLEQKSTNSQGLTVKVPVMSANMDSCTDGKMALAMYKAGAMGAIHRFMSIEQNLTEYMMVSHESGKCFVSVGVNSESQERTMALYAHGARYFIVDIAHGHSRMMQDMLVWMRGHLSPESYIVAGNVATEEGAADLFRWGADAVKIGIGPGAVCTTKNVTGVTVPQWSAVFKTCSVTARERYSMIASNRTNNRPILIADGGIQEIGDIAKALGAGADLVMAGRLFASCLEAPGARVNGKKVYRGMASKDAMLTIKDASLLPTPEGVSTLLDITDDTANSVVTHIKGGLQSAMSYSNARNLKTFQENVYFGIRG